MVYCNIILLLLQILVYTGSNTDTSKIQAANDRTFTRRSLSVLLAALQS